MYSVNSKVTHYLKGHTIMKFLERLVWANSVDPDQTALFTSLLASFGHMSRDKTKPTK